MTLFNYVPYNVACCGIDFLLYPLSPALSLWERGYKDSPQSSPCGRGGIRPLNIRIYRSHEDTSY